MKSFYHKEAEITVGKPHDLNRPKYIEVYAHRGARCYSPENTLPGYCTGLKIGTNWIDIDVGMTSDGVLVASHDLWLNPDIVSQKGGFFAKSRLDFITDHALDLDQAVQPYLLHNLSLKEVKKFDVGIINSESPYSKLFPNQVPVLGTKIPTLQEVIDYAHRVTSHDIYFQIEIKNDVKNPSWTVSSREFASALYVLLKTNSLIRRVEVQAFDWQCLFELKKLDKQIKTAFLVGYDDKERMMLSDLDQAGLFSGGKLLKDYNNSLPQMVKALGGDCYEPEDVLLTKEELVEAHALGLKVVPWTWPEHVGTTFDSQMVAKLIDWGVDGIITDDPIRLNSMLLAKGLKVPKTYR
jgi:glycerophosphoryl diester phosphodiesterase